MDSNRLHSLSVLMTAAILKVVGFFQLKKILFLPFYQN